MKKLFLGLQPPIFLKRLCSFILAFVLAFGLWFGAGARAKAGDIQYQPGSFTYGGKEYVYYYTDSIYTSDNSVSLSQYFYVLLYKGSSTGGMIFCSKNSGNIYYKNVYYGTNLSDRVYFCGLSGIDMSVFDSSMLNYYTGDNNKLLASFMTYLSDNNFPLPDEVKQPFYFEKHSPQMDIAFSLKKATASVQDGVLSTSWNGTSNMTINLFQNSVVDVSINYTDLDSGITYDIQYPLEAAASGLNLNFIKPGNTYYLVSDNGFEIELAELEEDYFNTTNYSINSICLTPYYYGNDNVISDNIYIGLSSVIDIGYDSTVGDDVVSDSTQVILPGTNYDPDDPFKSLYDQQNDLFNGLINGYDNTGINNDNDALNNSLSGYDAATSAIFNSASGTLSNFSFEDNLNFSVGLVTALGFVKGFVDDFFVASGDFSVIVTVVYTLIFMSIVIGISRFKGK